MHAWILLVALLGPEALAWSPSGDAPASAEDPFSWEVPPAIVAAGAPARVPLHLHIPPEHFVYTDVLEVEVLEAGPFEVQGVELPEGRVGVDPATGAGQRPQVDEDTTIWVVLEAPEDLRGGVPVTVRTRHQGCRTGLCYAPSDKTHSLLLAVRAPEDVPDQETR